MAETCWPHSLSLFQSVTALYCFSFGRSLPQSVLIFYRSVHCRDLPTLLRVARAVMGHTWNDLLNMTADNNIPALEQALLEGFDVNMVNYVS